MWFVWASAYATVHDISNNGETEVVLELPAFGRYAIETRSEVGIQLALVDRSVGPFASDGFAGEENGRVDVFLDRGQVKAITKGPSDGRGASQLVLTPFEAAGRALALERGQPIAVDLEDKQSQSFEFDTQGLFEVEVIGRHLADVRLWTSAGWLVDATPQCSSHEAVEGQPLTRCVLRKELVRGDYSLVAYGGPGKPWSEEAPDASLSVRWGAPSLPKNGMRTGRIGPTGLEYFEVPKSVNAAQLALPEIAEARIDVRPATHLFAPVSGVAITDESRLPMALDSHTSNRPNSIAIQGRPGQKYSLTWLSSWSRSVSGSGPTLVTAISTARPTDQLPATGVFFRKTGDGRTILVDHDAFELAPGRAFEQRFELLVSEQMFVELTEEMDVLFEVSEGTADLVFERYFTSPPKDYLAPKARRDRWSDRHPPGIYVLKIQATEPGIVTVRGAPNGWFDMARSSVVQPNKPGLRKVLELDGGAPVQISAFHPTNTRASLDVRSLPLDVTQPVAIPLAPGETYRVPVRSSGPVRLAAILPNGERLPLSGFGNPSTELRFPGGTAAISVENDTDAPVVASFGAVEDPIAPSSASPRTLPVTPKLGFGRPHFADIEGVGMTLDVDVPEDGLYSLHTTGLLATKGTLRGRVRFGIANAESNGIGRNFAIAQYLRAGRYQLEVAPTGSSRGHLGVELAKSPIVDGGGLEEGRSSRATLAPGEGLKYRFEVIEPGPHHIQALSDGSSRPCRLEDEGGWPVVRPTTTCDLHPRLEKGTYVLQLAPADVETRRVTQITRDRATEAREGRGPFVLNLGQPADHTWTEPPGEGDRPTDTWSLHVPADLKVSLNVGDEMSGVLKRDGAVVARLSPGRTWRDALEHGDYTVEVRAARRGTGVPYTVSATTHELTVGQRRSTYDGGQHALVVGTPGLVTIRSEGSTDTRARLTDADGTVVAVNDNRPDDWNFRLEAWLTPGRYTLDVAGGATELVVSSPAEQFGEPLKTGRSRTVTVSDSSWVFPLELGATKTLVEARVEAKQNVGLGIEMRDAHGWHSLGTRQGTNVRLLARRLAGHDVRLRVWSLDGRSEPVELTVNTPSVRSPSAAALADGFSTRSGWVLVDGRGADAGLFRIVGDRQDIVVCQQLGVPCEPASGVVALNDEVVLSGPRLQLERADLSKQPVPVALVDRPRTIDPGLDGWTAFQIVHADGTAVARFDDGAVAMVPRGSMALGQGEVSVRGSGVGRVRATALANQRVPWDREVGWSGAIPPRTLFVLPNTREALGATVALERGLVASLGDKAVWADTEAVRGTLSGSGALLLANPTDREALAIVHPAGKPAETLLAGQPLEQYATRAGVEVLDVDPANGRLHVLGAELTYLDADGALHRGTTVPIGPGGTAWVSHGVGWFAVYSDETGPGPWPRQAGVAMLAEPGVTRVESAEPFAVLVEIEGQERVEWRPEGGVVDILTSSRGDLRVRTLKGDGRPTLQRPGVRQIGEGLGEEVLIDSGSAAWFRFTLDEETTVGMGVRAGADRVTTTLVHESGEVMGEGVIQKLDLLPGTYFLKLHQAADAPPVRARPALAGLKRPDHGPPDEVIEEYLTKAGLLPGGAP